MKAWIGKSLVAIGIAHTIVGILLFRSVLAVLVKEGLINTIPLNAPPEREAAFWFLFSGFELLIIGSLVNRIECNKESLPSFLGWTLAVLTILGLIIMPASGSWLLIVPTVAMIHRGISHKDNVSTP